MTTLDDYAERYRDIRFIRRDGVLEMTLHSGDGPLLWNDRIHTDLGDAFHQLGQDTENKVVIPSGTGDAFCPGPDADSFHFDTSLPPVALDQIYREGKAMLFNQLAVPVPMIAAVNGPATAHSELALLCDILLVVEHTVFADHHLNWGIVPGDGIHIAYPMAFGMNRGRHLALTGTQVTAQQAVDWGAAAEVLPADRLRHRAWEIAADLATRPVLGLRYTRELLTREIVRQLRENLGYGLALEGFASGYGSWGATLHSGADS